MRKLRAAIASLAAAAAFVLFVDEAHARQPRVVWAKAEVGFDAMQTAFEACAKDSKDAGGGTVMTSPPYVAGAGVIGAGVGTAFAYWIQSLIDAPKFRERAIRACMFTNGYHAIRLSPAEEADLRQKSAPDATVAWTRGFYAQPDFAARLSASIAPPLPEAGADDIAYGAVRFDPGSLVVANQPLGPGGIVLSGTVVHRRTAKNLQDVYSDINSGGLIRAGTVLQQGVFADGSGQRQTFWCGTFKAMIGSPNVCVRNDGNGFLVLQPEGTRWITTGLDVHGAPGVADPESFHLEVSDSDLIGPMKFAMAIRKVAANAITLEAVVNQGSDFETIWKGTIALDDAGRAVLPFWRNRLILTRTGNQFIATFAPDGDGTGWPG